MIPPNAAPRQRLMPDRCAAIEYCKKLVLIFLNIFIVHSKQSYSFFSLNLCNLGIGEKVNHNNILKFRPILVVLLQLRLRSFI